MNIYQGFRPPLVVVVFLLVIMICGCGGGSSSGDSGNQEGDVPDITQASSVIGIEGGEVMIENTSSPADGAKIIVPESALAEDNTITISHGETDFSTPAGMDSAGGQIDFGPDDLQFLLPVHISIPYTDDNNDGIIDGTNTSENNVQLIYYNEAAGQWEDVAIINKNTQGNLVEAETDHFSTYLVAIDTSTSGNNNGGDTSAYVSGEYFVGSPEYRVSDDGTRELRVKGCIEQDYSTCAEGDNCRPCGSHYVLTVTAREGPVKGVVDKRTTLAGGVSATLNADGTGFIFDAAAVFDKIKNSGDAGLWTWRCEYITEHTHLLNYAACDDNSSDDICSDAGTRITPSIEVVDETNILFNLGIDVSDESYASGEPMPGPNFTSGDMIAIRFEANYI